jgi:F-type H+-transporting ATPase subunit b
MEETLRSLGEVLLNALPTFFLVILLHFFLKAVFFKPLETILAARKEATEGARQQAAASLDLATAKAAAYEESIRAARNEMYKEQEELRKKWRDENAARVLEARKRAEAMVKEAKAQIAAQAAEARQSLQASAQNLADQITVQVLGRGA